MVFEVQKGRACGEALLAVKDELQKAEGVIITLNSELHTTEQQVVAESEAKNFAVAGAKEWEGRFNNQKDLTQHQTVQKRKWKFATFVAVTVIVLREVFIPD